MTETPKALPRTWHRDLVFARSLIGATPLGVLWVSERKNGDARARCHRLLALSAYRLFVSNGKAGLVSGFSENAHLFDLRSISYRAGDAIELHFGKLRLVVDDTVGTQFLTTLWSTLGRISHGVPRDRLPRLDGGAAALVDAFERVRGPDGTGADDGLCAAYGAACDFFGAKPRDSVAAYVRRAVKAAKTRRSLRLFDVGAALREPGTFRADDLPALARALRASSAFDGVVRARVRSGGDFVERGGRS